ncbi:MAG: tetratricopeptide repeat protein, partial [Actinobacteria bacterium]|nr:tetratricopeptide repeat protein [Actinomycetota bacterium]
PHDSTITPWNVRETLLSLGALAARQLGRWQQALDLNTETLDSMRRRGASDAEQAIHAANDYAPLLRLGRPAEARDLLIRCRDVFEANNDIPLLGKTLSALADVEDTLGHQDRAIDLETDALRFSYLAADPEAGVSHTNLANYLQRSGGDPQRIWAHRLAAAIIDYQTGGGYLASDLQALARLLAAEPAAAPGEFTQVCQIVDQIDGVHLADLLARLPQRAPDGQAAMDQVLRLAPEAGAEHNQQVIAGWDPVLSALHAAISHSDPATRDAATDTLNHALTTLDQQPEWQALIAVLRRIHAGECELTLIDGLGPVDTAITRRALDLLAGTTTIDPDAWRTLTADAGSDEQGDLAGALALFAAAVAAAAGGDTHAQGVVGPALDEMAADPDWAPLVTVLRRILNGDHTVATPDELGPAQVAVLDAVRAHLNPPQPTATPENP